MLTHDVPMFEPFPVELGRFTLKKLHWAVKASQSGKAPGPDGNPAEYWKAVLNQGISMGVRWLLGFRNEIWCGKQVPSNWY